MVSFYSDESLSKDEEAMITINESLVSLYCLLISKNDLKVKRDE